MRTITLSKLRASFAKVENLLAAGEEVSLTKRGKIVATISRPRRPKPDFAKRFALDKTHKVRPGKSVVDLVIEERDSYRW